MVELTVEDRPFWVRASHVVAVGTDVEGRTLVTVAYLGPLPVAQSTDEVLSLISARQRRQRNAVALRPGPGGGPS